MEESQLFSSSSSFFFFFSIASIIFLLFLWVARPKDKGKIIGGGVVPPGPWKLPLLGNLHQLAAAKTLPHQTFRDLSLKYGPLMHFQLGELSTVVVSSPEVAKQVMKIHDLAFLNRPQTPSAQILTYGYTDIAFAPYGEYWRQMKKMCTLELLSSKKVHSLSSVRQDEVRKLKESVQSSLGSAIDVTTKIYSLTSAILTRAAFGIISREQKQELVELLNEALIQLGKFDLANLFPSIKPIHVIAGGYEKLKKSHKKIDKILENIIKENTEKQMRAEGDRHGSVEENIVEVLLRIQQDGSLPIPITTDNIKSIIWDMFAGGTDTSATTLEWAMSELMRNPKVMEKAQAEITKAFRGKKEIQDGDMDKLSYLKLVIKETLRLHPPVPLLVPRICTEACKINGYEIPIKTQVMINAWALGRDPTYWYEAESFIPERFEGSSVDFKGTNFEYIPFGAGRRMCPGISFGLASVELPLATLLYHFDWELPNGMKAEDLDMTEGPGINIGRKNKLCLIPIPYDI